MGSKSKSHSHRKKKVRKFLRHHWRRTLYLQLAAYVAVLFLWVLPIPNPVKILAVTFHELSHAVMGLLTGATIYGFAIAPNGAGVTFGVGGNFFLILIAGYIGSACWGGALYAASVRWRPIACIIALELFIMFTGAFGWLNEFTMFFGIGSMFIMTLLLFTPDWCKVFFVRMVASACCLYAPLELAGEAFNLSEGPRVMGEMTQSDVVQLGNLLHMPVLLIAALLLAAQGTLLVYLVRKTCDLGAHEALTQKRAEHARRSVILRDLEAYKPKPEIR